MDETTEMKECEGCGAKRPTTDFNTTKVKIRGGSPYRKSKCKTCTSKEDREGRLRHKAAGPRPPACECCLREGKLHLDHCHTTGLLRGWICVRCNTGIGNLGDNLIRLRRTLVYTLSFLDREGLSEEETRSPFRDVPEGCCEKCGELRKESDFRVCSRSTCRVNRACTCRFCEAAAKVQGRRLAKLVGPPATACDICRSEGTTLLDHCHVTGKFRGWLCRECNVGLGKLGDDIAGVRRAIAYLERWLFRIPWSDVAQRARSRSPRRGDGEGDDDAGGEGEAVQSE
jgi:hypothetical protein